MVTCSVKDTANMLQVCKDCLRAIEKGCSQLCRHYKRQEVRPPLPPRTKFTTYQEQHKIAAQALTAEVCNDWDALADEEAQATAPGTTPKNAAGSASSSCRRVTAPTTSAPIRTRHPPHLREQRERRAQRLLAGTQRLQSSRHTSAASLHPSLASGVESCWKLQLGVPPTAQHDGRLTPELDGDTAACA